MHPRAELRAVTRTWRRHGAWAAFQQALEVLVNALVPFERLHIIELSRPVAQTIADAPPDSSVPSTGRLGQTSQRLDAAFSTRFADEATLDVLQCDGGWGIDETKRALLRAGNTCVLSLVAGRIAGYTWVHTQGSPEFLPGLRLQLPQGALYNFAGFTHPDFRGAGLQARRHQALWAQPVWADRDLMFGYVKATNFASRQGQARGGYRKVGTVLRLGPDGRWWTWLSPALRRRGLRWLTEPEPPGPAQQGSTPPAQPDPGPHPMPVRLLGRTKRDLDRAWVGVVSHTFGPWLHRRLLRQARRSDHHTYTCFHRSPVQLAALSGPVLMHLGLGQAPQTQRIERRTRRLRVLLYACSNGAEAYTLSAWLALQRPDLDVIIEASDLHPEMVERARQGRYAWEEVVPHRALPQRFLAQTFDRDGDHLVVNDRTRSRVSFTCADIVRDDLRARFGEADIVLAQNVLFHLPPALARRAFDNVVATVAPVGALLVEGMDLDLRQALTAAHDLEPLEWSAREIYEESRRHIPARWWRFYYGAEPWLWLRREPLRRYGSIFLKSHRQLRSPALPSQALAA